MHTSVVSLVAVAATAYAAVVPSYPTTTASPCPAPGSEDSQGRYSCNPAHQYPNGQTCESVDGCYFLQYPASSTSSAPSYPTSSGSACPAPGSEDSQGRYSCNPAHQYPNGQTCELTDGCYFLQYPASSTSSAPSYPTGSTSSAPAYSTSSTSLVPVYPTSSTTSAPPYATTSTNDCPAPGSEDSQGRYSCNPAHQYPNGQTCELVDGCYFLQYPVMSTATPPYPSGKPVPSAPGYNGTVPSGTGSGVKPSGTNMTPPPYTGAAASAGVFSGAVTLVAAALAFVL